MTAHNAIATITAAVTVAITATDVIIAIVTVDPTVKYRAILLIPNSFLDYYR